MGDFVVYFNKDNNYRRFNISGILTSKTRGRISVDLYEETSPLMTKFIFRGDGTNDSENEEGSLINIVHASALIDIESIPTIIDSLQKAYDRHYEELRAKETSLGDQ